MSRSQLYRPVLFAALIFFIFFAVIQKVKLATRAQDTKSQMLIETVEPEMPVRDMSPMEEGYAAASRGDFLSAIQFFEKASESVISGEVYYNLALAESKVPGRELRAVAWFGAYLAVDPATKNAPAIRETINALKTEGMTRFIKITEQVAHEIPGTVKQLYLIDMAELWAMIGNYSAAAEVIDSIEGAYNADSAAGKMVQARVKKGDFAGALQTAAMIRTPSINGAALRTVAEAQAISGDMEAAFRTVESIPDLFCKSNGYQWLAKVQLKNGDRSGALQSLEKTVQIAESVSEPYFKDLSKQYAAITQAEAGDIAAAVRTIAGINDPFQVTIAKLYTAEWQAHAGDMDGARQMLAEGLLSIDSVIESSKSIAHDTYQEVKTKIDNGAAGSREAASPPPDASFESWINLNRTLLYEPIFLDFKGYVSALPSDSPEKIFEALRDTAKKMLAAYDVINQMLKAQEAAVGV